MSTAPALRSNDARGAAGGRRLWLLGPPAAAIEAERRLRPGPGLAVEPATAEHVCAEGSSADWALLTGLSTAETVEAADLLLERGLRVAIEVETYAALGRALGRQRWGVECVALSPAPPSELSFRVRDLVAAGGALIALSPLLAAIAVLVQRSSPGPILFSTAVVGRGGRPFTWWKFRSMRQGGAAEEIERRREQYRAYMLDRRSGREDAGAPRKVIDESRVTPVGRFIRRHSLDELPQLWNVLQGQMTLVGPRPVQPYEYELHAPWQRLRFRGKPGLTGPWQAYGRSRVSFEEMALMDFCYLYARSHRLDLRLMLRTLLVVLTGEGGK